MADPLQPADCTSSDAVVAESRSTLYSDIVWRKGHQIFSRQRITLKIEEVERTLNNGNEFFHLELIGYPYQNTPKKSVPSFRLDLSNQHWEHRANLRSLHWRLSIGENENTYHQTFTFQVNSGEQLAAWTAQFHQSSNYFARDILSRSYHVILPEAYSEALNVSTAHSVLSCWSENDSVLVAEDPITGAFLQMWDIRRIDDFSVDFQSQLGMKFSLKNANDPPVRTETILQVASIPAAEKLFLFFESIVSRKLPRFFALLTKREVRAANGVTPLAISYDYDPEEDSQKEKVERIDGKLEADEQKEDKPCTKVSRKSTKKPKVPPRKRGLPPLPSSPSPPPRDLLRPGIRTGRSEDSSAHSV